MTSRLCQVRTSHTNRYAQEKKGEHSLCASPDVSLPRVVCEHLLQLIHPTTALLTSCWALHGFDGEVRQSQIHVAYVDDTSAHAQSNQLLVDPIVHCWRVALHFVERVPAIVHVFAASGVC